MKSPSLSARPLSAPFRSLAGEWNQFWFTPADPTVLAFLRICTGIVLVWVLLMTTPILYAFYGPEGALDAATMNRMRLETPWMLPARGWSDPSVDLVRYSPLVDNEQVFEYRRTWYVDPSVVYARGLPQFSPFFHLTTSRWVLVWHLLGIGVAVLFLLGLWTRVVSVLAWVITLGYFHRATPALFGMDTMFSILLFYLMFAPCGAALSLDRLLERYRQARRSLQGPHAPWSPAPEPSVSANVVTRLLQIHFCIMYLAAGLSKLQGTAWWDGTAMWMTLSNYEFQPPRSGLYTDLLRTMTSNRWVWEAVNSFGSVFTIGLEVSFPFLVWSARWRWLMLIGAVMLHTGIALAMGLVAFSLLMIIIAGSFIPVGALHRALETLFKGPATLSLVYSARQKIGLRLAALVHAIDVWGQVTLVDASKPHSELAVEGPLAGPRLVTAEEEVLGGYPLFERLVRSLRVLWPLALLTWLPGVGRLGRALAPGEGAAREKEAVGAR